jgi:YNFM family putative membrane transporter
MSRRALTDPALLSLYAIGAVSVGAFVAVYNVIGFRLTAAPFGLGASAAAAVFLVYPVGTVSSTVAGRLADRFGRRAVMPFGSLITAAGLVLTLADRLPYVVAGLAVMTAGFFCVHGVASGWVPARAHLGGAPAGHAASYYLVAYYAGSSIIGSLSGTAWTLGGWPAVVALASVFVGAGGILALNLLRVPALQPAVTR